MIKGSLLLSTPLLSILGENLKLSPACFEPKFDSFGG